MGDKNIELLTSSRRQRAGRAPRWRPAASASRWWSRRAGGGWGCRRWRTSGTKCPPSAGIPPQRSPSLNADKETEHLEHMPTVMITTVNMKKVIITQHVWGHPSSFDPEAEDDPEHEDGDVVWRHSQHDPSDPVEDVGQEEAESPAEPAAKTKRGNISHD